MAESKPIATELILRDEAELNEEAEVVADEALDEPEPVLATVWAEGEPETVVAEGALVLVTPKPEELPGTV